MDRTLTAVANILADAILAQESMFGDEISLDEVLAQVRTQALDILNSKGN